MEIKRFKIKGSEADYIMTEDVFRKIENGFVWDMCRKSKKWIIVPELSTNLN